MTAYKAVILPGRVDYEKVTTHTKYSQKVKVITRGMRRCNHIVAANFSFHYSLTVLQVKLPLENAIKLAVNHLANSIAKKMTRLLHVCLFDWVFMCLHISVLVVLHSG